VNPPCGRCARQGSRDPDQPRGSSQTSRDGHALPKADADTIFAPAPNPQWQRIILIAHGCTVDMLAGLSATGSQRPAGGGARGRPKLT